MSVWTDAALAHPRRTTWMLFGVALLLRVGAVAQGGRFAAPATDWDRGYEVGAVAASIADGRGFADPFGAPTGPTAAIGPLVPAVWAIPMRVFGTRSPWAWRSIVFLDVLLLALVVPAVGFLGTRIAGARFGLLCAAAWTFHPLGLLLARGYLGTLAAFAVVVTLVLERTLALEQAGAAARGFHAATLGFALGGSLWIEPLLVPFALAWLVRAWLARRPEKRMALLAVLFAGLLAVPWVIRNAVVVGMPTLRSAAGPELWLGALAGPGEPTPIRVHPSRNRMELEHLEAVGEKQQAHEKLAAAFTLIRERPARWVAACAWRLGNFWVGRFSWWQASGKQPILAGPLSALRGLVYAGLAALAVLGIVSSWRRVPAAGTLALLFATYPITYALTHVEARYRLPLEPVLTVAACLLVLRWRAVGAAVAPPSAPRA